MGFRLVCFAIPIVLCLIFFTKFALGRYAELVTRLACAALAGLSSAAVAGGIQMLLRSTPYGLGARIGDSQVLATWASGVQRGIDPPAVYPPLQIHMIAWIADLLHVDPIYAIKPFQLLGLILVGPLAYTAWRLLLSPVWALSIGLVAALPLIEAFRPYPPMALAVFIPVALHFLQVLQRTPTLSIGEIVQAGLLYGIVVGVVCLLYSGWLLWSASGFFIVTVFVFPWRTGFRHGSLLCGLALIAFLAITGRFLLGILNAPSIADSYMVFDARVDPAYIAMWRGDLPGVVERLSLWPPAGELSGVGLFSILLVVGFGAAIAMGRNRTVVMGLAWMMVGAWLLRFWYAQHMWATGLIQLYTRSTAELLYCGLLLCGFAIRFACERYYRRLAGNIGHHIAVSAKVGALSAYVFLICLTASATLDRYMPKDDPRDVGYISWRALFTPKLNAKNKAAGALITVSSSYEDEGFSKRNLLDGNLSTHYSSELSSAADREEWIEFELDGTRSLSRMLMHAPISGFPIDFTIDVWTGNRWVTCVSRTDYHPSFETEFFVWNKIRSSRLRIHITKMNPVDAGTQARDAYAVRLREIELY